MASADGGSPSHPEEPSTTSANPHSPIPSLTVPSSTVNLSEDWEYEYSATEIETYYLTLDLTTPSIPCTQPKIAKSGRGGYKSAWINPGLGRLKRHLRPAPVISLSKAVSKDSASTSTSAPAAFRTEAGAGDEVGNNLAEEEGVQEDGEEEEEEEGQDDAIKNTRARPIGIGDFHKIETPKKLENIEILELHSDNPIISFKGQVYSCEWAENIGTELLFTSHDPSGHLPVLRTLPDGVDLLAASSARIISKVVTLRKTPPVAHAANIDRVEDGAEHDVSQEEGFIPVGRGAREERREQARFLERITEIKQQRGESDAVTIIAQKRLHVGGWRAVMKEKRDKERAELQPVIRNGGKQGHLAAQRLEEINREEEEEENKHRIALEVTGSKKVGRKPRVLELEGESPAKRVKRTSITRRPRGNQSVGALEEDQSSPRTPSLRLRNQGRTTLSMPTPQSWDDLGLDGAMHELGDDDGDEDYEDDTAYF